MLQKAYLDKIQALYEKVLDVNTFMTIYQKLNDHYKDDIAPTLFTVPSSFANEKAQKYYLHISQDATTFLFLIWNYHIDT